MSAAGNPVTAYLALGSNLGDRAAHIRSGTAALAAHPAVDLLGVSRLYQTPPWGPVPLTASRSTCSDRASRRAAGDTQRR